MFVDEAWAPLLGERSADEEAMLEVTAVEPTDLGRLGCQIRCTAEMDGLTVYLPEARR